jgi:outer membrane lipopolysaccharide assembly protein LptE/RlpB
MEKSLKFIYSLLFSVYCLLLTSSCGVYSFTGASIAPDVKTFSVDYIKNRASLTNPALSQVITQKLKDKFISQTSLSPLKADGDLRFEGYISDYNTQPIAIQSNDQAAQNRLTITVSIKFTNTKDEKQNFETTFSRFADYATDKDLSSVEAGLIENISSQLIDDIFNKAVVNW